MSCRVVSCRVIHVQTAVSFYFYDPDVVYRPPQSEIGVLRSKTAVCSPFLVQLCLGPTVSPTCSLVWIARYALAEALQNGYIYCTAVVMDTSEIKYAQYKTFYKTCPRPTDSLLRHECMEKGKAGTSPAKTCLKQWSDTGQVV